MNDSFISYIIGLLVIIIAIFLIKKIASCLIRTIIFIVALAIIAAIVYYIKFQ